MKLSAILEDETVIVDGVARTVPGLRDAFPTLWAVQWRDGAGEAETRDGRNIAATQDEVDALIAHWESAAPIPPAPPTLEQAKAAKLAELRRATDAAAAAVRSQYPETERESWDQQAKEAEAYLADTTQDGAVVAPLLQVIATERGVSLEDIANRVMTKQAQFKALAGAAIGTRQRLEDAVEAATTVAQVESITWPA